MNQGNDKSHAGDDGIYHDGCLVFQYPNGKYRAFFMAFQSQSFNTDDKTGHAIPGGGPPVTPPAKKGAKKSPKKVTKRKR